jgi:threonine synthase
MMAASARFGYVSTRRPADAPHERAQSFTDVLLAGLAYDGGLYVPEAWPRLSVETMRSWRGLPYADLAFEIIRLFTGDAIAEDDLRRLIRQAYAAFGHAAVTPLRQLDERLWLMELFHGPTLAFKDVALQLLGRLFDHVLQAQGRRITIVGATSGDTGSAAIEACRDRAAIDIVIVHPHERTSQVQRRQMTTVRADNVHNIALLGSFDDAQDAVKAMFNDRPYREALHLSAVNSINWARIMAQIVYYAAASLALGGPDRPVAFSVPTGNFGNIYAAYAASRMGFPIARLVAASNENDIVPRFFATGEMRAAAVAPTISPSMDIQSSSNFERLLFELLDRDGAVVAACMERFKREGAFSLPADRLQRARSLFDGYRCDEAETLRVMAETWHRSGIILDPHTATGVAAARYATSTLDPAIPRIVMGTAHPAKFPETALRALGFAPPLPPTLADLYERQERFDILPNDMGALKDYIRARSRAAQA